MNMSPAMLGFISPSTGAPLSSGETSRRPKAAGFWVPSSHITEEGLVAYSGLLWVTILFRALGRTRPPHAIPLFLHRHQEGTQ